MNLEILRFAQDDKQELANHSPKVILCEKNCEHSERFLQRRIQKPQAEREWMQARARGWSLGHEFRDPSLRSG